MLTENPQLALAQPMEFPMRAVRLPLAVLLLPEGCLVVLRVLPLLVLLP